MSKKIDLAQLVCEFAKEKGYVIINDHNEYDVYKNELVIKMTFAKWLDPLGAANLIASIRKNPFHNSSDWRESKKLQEVADVKRIMVVGDWIIFSSPTATLVNAHDPDSLDKLSECLNA